MKDAAKIYGEALYELARSEELDRYSEYINTEEFAEWYAKEKLGLIHKNEIIFKGE